MLSNETIKQISPDLIFKNDQTVIKSEWNYSFWNRKQIRIKVTSSGELAVQTIAQNTLARLTSKILKLFSRNYFKSIGKKIESFNFSGFSLPSNLAVPLSEQKQKDLLEIQSQQLALYFLPTHKKLSDLGSELIEVALQNPEKCGQAVRIKILDLCQEILDFQLKFSEELQKDLPPAELYAKFQEYEKQAEIFCEEFPKILMDFIAKSTVEMPLTPSIYKYLDLLDCAKTRVAELKARLQFTSADWLEREIEKTINLSPDQEKLAIESLEDALDCIGEDTGFAVQLESLPHDSPYEQQLKGLVISEIRQTLTNFGNNLETKQKAYDKLIQNTTEINSWHQDFARFFETTQEKAKIYSEKHNRFESLIPGFEAGMQWISSNDPWIDLENLDRHSLIKHKNNVEHFCASTLNFIENETQVEKIAKLTPQYAALNTQVSLKIDQLHEKQYLHRAELEKIQNEHARSIANISASLSNSKECQSYVQILEKAIHALKNKFEEIEKNPDIALIDQLAGLEKIQSPIYDEIRSQLIDEAKTQLDAFVDVLQDYQKILSDALPILKETGSDILEQLIELEQAIQAKIAEAQALTVDFKTRLHFWELFNSDVKINELPTAKLKDYMNKVSCLVLTGIDEIIQEAENIGIKFN